MVGDGSGQPPSVVTDNCVEKRITPSLRPDSVQSQLSKGDEVWLAASIIKVPIGLEFFSQVEKGELDPRTPVTLALESRTPGPTGISLGVDP